MSNLQSKRCPKCEQVKSSGEFFADPKAKSGLQSYCKPCAQAYQAELRRKRYNADPEYRRVTLERNLQCRAKHKEEYKAKQREKYRNIPLEERKVRARRAALKSRYGITTEEYDALVAAQQGKCGICGRKPKRLAVDHDHKTGIIRGLLCRHCNRAIGVLGDTIEGLQRAINYLKGAKVQEPSPFTG